MISRSAVHQRLFSAAIVAATVLVVLGIVATMYWPARHGGFVWDDTSSIYEEAALRGDAWKLSILRGFNGWVNYFRPLVVLLFVAETRAFDFAPGPMHVVSLAIHLADTLLVGLLAIRLSTRTQSSLPRAITAGLSMAFYGLHPALIEPVDWIGCQFELAVIFFMLLGLLFNFTIRVTLWRALAVAACFFVAAGFKEAAVSFPLLLGLLDVLVAQADGGASALLPLLRVVWRRQRMVYAGILIAGVAYLVLRHWALGFTLNLAAAGGDSSFDGARLHQVCLTYLSYWRLIVWPMSAIGPIHAVDTAQFHVATMTTLATDALAITTVAVGVYAFCRRRPLGCFILAISAALIPVLNVIPIGLGESLYHDRYAATGIAVACVMMPLLLAPLLEGAYARVLRPSLTVVAVVWLGFAIVNIRVTVPLWADEVTLWQWVLRQHPDSVTAKDLLLTAYMHRNDLAHARALADELVANRTPCLACMLNAANLAIENGDAARAALAMRTIDEYNLVAGDVRYLPRYILTRGRLRELGGDLAGAEAAYRDAIQADALDPEEHLALALVLARQGKTEPARAAMAVALPMFAPDQREARRRRFEAVMTESGNRTP